MLSTTENRFTDDTMNVRLISSVEVTHPLSFDQGPRITRRDYVALGASTVVVEFWTESGRLVRVSPPRPLEVGEIVPARNA